MIIIPFKKEHLDRMILQEKQRGLEYLQTDELFDSLEGQDSYSAIDYDQVICCSGVVAVAHGRGVAWSYLSQDIGNRIVAVTRAIRIYLNKSALHRIEIHVDCDFPQAHRWAKMLGFEMECERMRAFTPDKRDCALYAKVNV
jgi:hypothetical protein